VEIDKNEQQEVKDTSVLITVMCRAL